ncbi:MAG TPA: hypothetical protein VGC39_10315, partial [Candidatus Methylacidiphilales bacterium]
MLPRPSRYTAPTDSTRQNGNGANANGSLSHRTPITGRGNSHLNRPKFLAPFLGAFAAVLLVAAVRVGSYFGFDAFHFSSLSNRANKTLIENVSAWQTGQEAATKLDGNASTDIGWWTRTFDLPKQEAVTGYLQEQGLTVSRIEPAHYESTADGTTLTYNVNAEVPAQLVHLQKTAWLPINPDMNRFAHVLVLNDGLPAGTIWNTSNPTVAAEAGSKLDFAWKVHWDK